MPILEPDPWRQAFFDHFPCPDDLAIPTKDPDAYRLNPLHAWAYNKLMIAEKQHLMCGPHDIEPGFYPVFSKPIYNLRSMGSGSGVIADRYDFSKRYNPGFMWVEILKGEHLSTDVAVVNGKALWYAHAIGYPEREGTFDYWEILPGNRERVEAYLQTFISENFIHYRGMLNFETIGGRIIEMHLRFADQWPDLYGEPFVPNLIELYRAGIWRMGPLNRTGFSVVLFGEHRNYRKPSQAFLSQLIDHDRVTSIQLPFYEEVPYQQHSMPPGGFRLAIVNGFSLEQCKEAREAIHQEFMRLNDWNPKLPSGYPGDERILHASPSGPA
ncbi:hypothetical protein [Methylohalobius crimeensis]|uniref:hypothetical protein n=1 Tax=Methylohalobius crimeensis TaxID=244365 RepID=UPI0003B6C6F0|nr:hypothetical protein [Methylohalobius crimeensis]